jgi:hypothetical protein
VSQRIPPPSPLPSSSPPAVLLWIEDVSFNVTEPALRFEMPPPFVRASLPAMTKSPFTVKVILFVMPPPGPLDLFPRTVAEPFNVAVPQVEDPAARDLGDVGPDDG